jgi:sigma-E factor negative regulatory protein RseC
MITIKATVVAKTSDQVWIKSTAGCMSCQSSCGLAEIGRFLAQNHSAIALPCESMVKPGDQITIAVTESALLRAGLFAYLMPATLMILGAALATLAGGGDGSAVIGAVVGLTLGFSFIHLVNRYQKNQLSTNQFVQIPASTSGDLSS